MAMSVRFPALILLLLSSSCLTFGIRYVGSGSPPAIYDIDYAAPAEAGPGNGLVLRVRDFTCSSEFDASNMVFVDEEGRITRMSRNRWASNPASLIGDLLSRDLIAEGLFEGIYRRNPLCGEDLVMEGHVREFGAREAAGGWQAVLEVEIILLESAGGTIIFQKPYRFTAAADSTEGFQPFASCMSDLVRQCSDSIRSDLRDFYGAAR
jgi:ABC-type uncharacterized transport system auxiliary subunit